MDITALGPVEATRTQPLQGLVQGLAQRALQAALQTAVSPLATPAAGQPTGLDLVAGAGVQGATGAPATPGATATLPGAAVLADPDPAGAGLDFALLTALRHGAGVGTQAALVAVPADLSAGLVRDPAAVPALGPLQGQSAGTVLQPAARAPLGGSPAPTAYQVPAPPPGAGTLDLLA